MQLYSNTKNPEKQLLNKFYTASKNESISFSNHFSKCDTISI